MLIKFGLLLLVESQDAMINIGRRYPNIESIRIQFKQFGHINNKSTAHSVRCVAAGEAETPGQDGALGADALPRHLYQYGVPHVDHVGDVGVRLARARAHVEEAVAADADVHPIDDRTAVTGAVADNARTLREFKEASERAFLVGKLRELGWNISKTAEEIDTPRSNLYKKLEQYNISQETDA